MSGFFGMAREDGNLLEEKFLEDLVEELGRRGPDGTSVWTDGRVGCCFARMVTGPAKQTERQPAVLGERYLLWGDVRLDGCASCWPNLQPGICRLIRRQAAKNFCCLPGNAGTRFVCSA
jgi:hypothetical protein